MIPGLLIQIARVFTALSLVSIGGVNAVLPEIRRQVVDVQGWMNDAAFANLFAISHAAPGPNIIMVSLIGWQLAGLAGLLVATLAIMIPSCSLAFLAGRVVARWSDQRWISLLKEGLISGYPRSHPGKRHFHDADRRSRRPHHRHQFGDRCIRRVQQTESALGDRDRYLREHRSTSFWTASGVIARRARPT
jgi:hypothetical protein